MSLVSKIKYLKLVGFLNQVDWLNGIKNGMSIIISQKILRSWLLIVDKKKKKSNFSGNFKLKQVISYHIWYIVKIL